MPQSRTKGVCVGGGLEKTPGVKPCQVTNSAALRAQDCVGFDPRQAQGCESGPLDATQCQAAQKTSQKPMGKRDWHFWARGVWPSQIYSHPSLRKWGWGFCQVSSMCAPLTQGRCSSAGPKPFIFGGGASQ